MSIKNPILIPQVEDLLIVPKMEVFISREGEIQTSGMGNFREMLFAEGLSKETVDLITSESRIADLVENKLIPLVA